MYLKIDERKLEDTVKVTEKKTRKGEKNRKQKMSGK